MKKKETVCPNHLQETPFGKGRSSQMIYKVSALSGEKGGKGLRAHLLLLFGVDRYFSGQIKPTL